MKTVRIPIGAVGFAEDKDAAREIRVKKLLPALDSKSHVVLDFQGVKFATQSFIHALVGEALNRHGESALDLIEFQNCSSQLKSVIELVVDYSIAGFPARTRS
jgi:hypothetical protein